MKKSSFQFANPHIDEIIFKVEKSKEADFNGEMPVNINVQSWVEDANKGSVSLNLIVGEIDEETDLVTPVYFNGVISAEFIWNDEVQHADSMLKVSGGTVLLSYIRPILASLTMQAGIKPIHIPFINFTEE